MTPQPLEIHLPRRLGEVRTASGPVAAGEQPAPAQAAAAPGLEAERGQLRSALAALRAACAEVRQVRQRLVTEAEGQLVNLAIDIARKVLLQEIQAGRYEIDPIVSEALSRLPGGAEVVVRLNPADLSRCRLAEGADAPGAPEGVHFIADPAVAPAECLVQTPDGAVQSAIEEHLDEVGAALRGRE
jgi:flagellar assembly protein FliH